MDFLIPILNTLALAVAAILLIVGLVEAPWQLLLLLLVLATVVSQWLIRRSHLQSVLNELENSDSATAPQSPLSSSQVGRSLPPPDGFPSSQSSDSPFLYRGASYTPPQFFHRLSDTQDVSFPVLEVSGKYRGSFWKSSSYTNGSSMRQK